MTQNEKDLLLKDLCARLPYGVKVKFRVNEVIEIKEKFIYNVDGEYSYITDGKSYLTLDIIKMLSNNYLDEIKPYLFPFSSMTEEQKQEYTYIVNYISSDDTENWKEGEFIYVEQFTQLMHFYHINHLDYMGLIPMGLANDATGLNIY